MNRREIIYRLPKKVSEGKRPSFVEALRRWRNERPQNTESLIQEIEEFLRLQRKKINTLRIL